MDLRVGTMQINRMGAQCWKWFRVTVAVTSQAHEIWCAEQNAERVSKLDTETVGWPVQWRSGNKHDRLSFGLAPGRHRPSNTSGARQSCCRSIELFIYAESALRLT
jgi:hypothetical protein